MVMMWPLPRLPVSATMNPTVTAEDWPFVEVEQGHPAHFIRVCHQGKRAGPLQIGGELQAAVRNPWSKTLLVDAPQGLEFLVPEVSQGEFHRLIVVARWESPGTRA